MATNVVGRLRTDLICNTSKFTAGMRKAGTDTQRFAGKVGKASVALKSFGAMMLRTAGIGIGISGVGYLIKRQMEAMDIATKFANKVGISTEALMKLRHAAELTGVQASTLDMALQRMTRRISEAGKGTGEAKAAIKELGLNAQWLAAMSPDKAFSAIAGAMAKVTSQSDRVRLAFKLFDSEGVALVNTLMLGEDGLRRVGDEAERLGITFDAIQAKQIEAANDAVTRLSASFRGLVQQLTIKVAPAIEKTMNKLTTEVGGGKGSWLAESNLGMMEMIRLVHKTNRVLLDLSGSPHADTARAKEQAMEDAIARYGREIYGPEIAMPTSGKQTRKAAATARESSGMLTDMFAKIAGAMGDKAMAVLNTGWRLGASGVAMAYNVNMSTATAIKRTQAALAESRLDMRKSLSSIFQGAPELQFAGGAGKGSQAAYSAIVRAMGQDQGKKMALDMQRQQLAEAKKAGYTLGEIKRFLSVGEGVNLDDL